MGLPCCLAVRIPSASIVPLDDSCGERLLWASLVNQIDVCLYRERGKQCLTCKRFESHHDTEKNTISTFYWKRLRYDAVASGEAQRK